MSFIFKSEHTAKEAKVMNCFRMFHGVAMLGVYYCSGLFLTASPFQNGSFEIPQLPTGTGQTVAPGSTNLPGWTIATNGSYGLQNGAAFGVNPVDGSQQFGFNGGNGPTGGSITQTFDTVAGQRYMVAFYVGRQGTGVGTMSLL